MGATLLYGVEGYVSDKDLPQTAEHLALLLRCGVDLIVLIVLNHFSAKRGGGLGNDLEQRSRRDFPLNSGPSTLNVFFERLVQGTSDTDAWFVQDVRVNHRCGNILVPKELLDGANVVSAFEQMGGERVTQRMTRSGLVDTSRTDGVLHRSLQQTFSNVVALLFATVRIDREPRRRKNVLPGPFIFCTGKFPRECMLQVHASESVDQILFMLSFDLLKVTLQPFGEIDRQHRYSLLAALSRHAR